MSKTRRNNQHQGGRQRRISVRAVRRESPDLRRLGQAVVAMALAQAAAEAAAEADQRQQESGASGTEPAASDDASEAGHD